MKRFGLLLVASLAVKMAAAQDWPRAMPEEAGLKPAVLAEMEADIHAGKFGPVGSVVIARHGKLAYEGYFAGDASTLRDTRSATKTIAAMLIGMAIERHKLKGVDQRVLALLPNRAKKLQNPDPRKQAITIEDLMTMSSPLECDDWNDASRGNEERMYVIEDWAQFILDLPIRGRMHLGETEEPAAFGRNFSYCTGGVFVLSEIIEKATGQRTDRFARSVLFDPLGIGQATWFFSPLGTPQTGGGLRLTSPDLLRLAQLYLDGGKWDGKQLIDADWVKRSMEPHARIDEKTTYGYLWWLRSFNEAPVAYMSGNGGNKVAVIPSLDMVAVITSTNFNTRGMHDLTDTILAKYVVGAAR